MMALNGGLLLCGLMAFGDQSYLYDDQRRRYDIEHANYTSYGNVICAYNVQVCDYYYTNQTLGTAVIFYETTDGIMKIFTVTPATSTTLPPIRGIETRWTGGGEPFFGRYSVGANASYETTLSWNPIYPTLSEPPVSNDSLAVGEEAAMAPGVILGADGDLGTTTGAYRFYVSVSPYFLIFYVYGDVPIRGFPQPAGYNANAFGMLVEIYQNNNLIATTDGIFYGFKVSSYQYRTYFTVFPNSTFRNSFSILCNYFSISSQNSVAAITPFININMVIQFAGN